MTVLPLVVSGLVVAIVSASRTGLVGSLGGRSVGLFLVLLASTALAAALVVPPLMAALPIGGDATASFRESLAATAATAPPKLTVRRLGRRPPPRPTSSGPRPTGPCSPSFSSRSCSPPPSAASPTAPAKRSSRFFRGVSEAMTVLLGWIVRLAPVAIFVLSLALAARVGLSATGALGLYVLVLSGLCVAQILLLRWRRGSSRAFRRPLRARRGAGPARRVRRALLAGVAARDARRRGTCPRRARSPSRDSSCRSRFRRSRSPAPVHCLIAAISSPG